MSSSNPVATSKTGHESARPFYVMVTLWGKRFRDYFLDFCAPSLLSPNNLPALAGKRPCKVLIATTPEDWREISGSPIFEWLRHHAEPVFIEIPPCPPGRAGCEHMGIGHKLQTDMAFRDKAFGMVLTPDLMVADGTLASLHRHAAAGTQVVLVAAFRFAEEPLFENLRATGDLPPAHASIAAPGRPLCLTARQLVAAAVRSFHSEGKSYEWDAPWFTDFPVVSWWRVPGEDGIVVHSFSWAPLLLDYAGVASHDTGALETWTMDADYVHANFGRSPGIHVVQDSDEAFVLSWGPLDDRLVDLKHSLFPPASSLGQLMRGANLRWTFNTGMFDPLKQQIFFLPVRWHAKPLNEEWTRVERRALATIMSYIAPPDGTKPTAFNPPQASERIRAQVTALVAAHRTQATYRPALLAALDALSLVLRYRRRVAYLLRQCWENRWTIARRTGQVLRGDRAAIRRVAWRLRTMGAQLVGRLHRAPGPPIPR